MAPRFPAFLQGGVVQLAVGLQQRPGVLFLPPGGVGAELVGATHDRIVAAGCDRPEVKGGGAPTPMPPESGGPQGAN